MSDVLPAIQSHLQDLAAGKVPAREKPTALQHGLLRGARDEIEQLQNIKLHAKQLCECMTYDSMMGCKFLLSEAIARYEAGTTKVCGTCGDPTCDGNHYDLGQIETEADSNNG